MKVKRRELPFKFLRQMEDEALKNFEDVMDQGMQLIEREIREGVPDFDENELEGQLRLSLKSSGQQEIWDFNRRITYNAPLWPNQVEDAVIQKMIDALTWEGGKIKMGGAFPEPEGDATKEEETVSLRFTYVKEIDAKELREVLKGKKQTILLGKNAGGTDYYAIQGQETIIALKAMAVPMAVAQVLTYDNLKMDSQP